MTRVVLTFSHIRPYREQLEIVSDVVLLDWSSEMNFKEKFWVRDHKWS